jgi:hypothetical protein
MAVAILLICATLSGANAEVFVGDEKFTTIRHAQQHVRDLRAAGASGEIVLDIGIGMHPPFSVSANDSGLHASARTIYRGKGTKTRISGGTEIPPALFKPSKNLQGGTLLTADISSLKLDPTSFGEIVAADCIHTCATTRAMLSFNDEEMTLARWPNFDRAQGRNVYTHLVSGGSGSFVVSPDDASVKARMLQWGKEGTGWVHGYWEWDWADCYRKIAGVTPTGSVWTIRISGSMPGQSPTLVLNGTAEDAFRVRAVATGGPDDPRHGICKTWNVSTQNILEQSHDNKTWALGAALDCGNGVQKIASANYSPPGNNLEFTFTPADKSPKKNARFYATNLLSELDTAVS